MATAIALFTLIVLGWVERRSHERRMTTAEPMRVKFGDLDQFSTALNMLERIDPDAMDLSLEPQSDGTTVLSVPVAADKRELVGTMMLACDGVIEIS